MQWIDFSFQNPADNLAYDEWLLEQAELGALGPSLRFWDSPVYFVVLGLSSHWKTETQMAPCKKDSLSILRRKSGGQTVLQGPGCLNFNLILPVEPHTGIQTDTQNGMKRNQLALQKLVSEKIELQGISDLTCGQKKFSGNAMRRGRRYYLFHGTFLYQFNLESMEHYLGKPDREPAYRKSRNHLNFVDNIPLNRNDILSVLKEAWQAQGTLPEPHPKNFETLKKNFYANPDWNFKY